MTPNARMIKPSVTVTPFSRTLLILLVLAIPLLYLGLNTHILPADICQQPIALLTRTNRSLVHAQSKLRDLNRSLVQTQLDYEELKKTHAEQAAPIPVSDLSSSSNTVASDNLEITATRRNRHNRPMPACAKQPQQAKAFFIVFMGHSGSTAILTELFSHSRIMGGHWEPVDHQTTFSTSAALETARAILEKGLVKGLTVGFKIRPSHILKEPDAWRALVKEYGVRIIWQYRKNVFKGAVGEYSHRMLNDTTVVEGLRTNLTREERCRLGVGCSFPIDDYDALYQRLRGMIVSQHMIAKAVSEIARDEQCVREVPYEDYLYDSQATINDILTFLGLEPEETSTARFKATGDNMCEVIENWDDVCDNFYGCVLWQHLMDDPRHGCYCRMSNGRPRADFCNLFPKS